MTLKRLFVSMLGMLFLFAAGCAPGHTPTEPIGTSQAAIVNVMWVDAVGVTTSGNSLTKTGSAGWNAGAASNQVLSSDGFVQLTTAETNTDKMAGLAHVDPVQNFAAIDFAFYLSSGGIVNIYESGTLAGSFGTYAAGDTFEVQLSGSTVTYLQNGSLVYTSTRTPTLPLLVGTSLYSTGATINNVVLSSAFWQDVAGVTMAGQSMTKTGTAGWNAGAATTGSLASDGYATFTTAETNTDKMAGLASADPVWNYAAIDFAFYLSSGGIVNIYEDGALAGSFGTYAAGDTFKIKVAGGVVSYLQNGSLVYTSTKTPTLPLLFGTSLYTNGATINNVTLVTYWQDIVGVSTNGLSLTKTGMAGWNAGAATVATLSGDGTAQFKTAESTTDKIAGLSHADPAQDPGAIDFAIYLSSSGSVNIYEDGTLAGSFGSYAAGDVFKVAVTGNVVTYLQNGSLLYTSTKTPTFPLLFGAVLYTTGATINEVSLVAAPPFWTDVVGVSTSGNNLTKTGSAGWNAGAATVATLSGDGNGQFTTAEATTDKIAGLSHSDPAQNPGAIDFAFYLSSGGYVNIYEDGTLAGSFGTYAAGDTFEIQVAGSVVTYLQNGSLLYTSTKSPTLPLLFGAVLYTPGATVNNVSLNVAAPFWTDVVGASTSGNSLTKTGSAGWNAGAATSKTLSGSGNAQFSTAETTTDKLAGLSHADPAQNPGAVDFGIYLSNTGMVNIYEDGTYQGTFGTYAAGDVFEIQVSGTVVSYLQNGTALWTSSKTPTFPLLVGATLYSTGATINNVTITP